MKRFTWPIWFFLLVSAVASAKAEAPNKPLTFDRLVQINERIIELDQFQDNEFIYDEKLAELLDESNEHKGSPVRLVVVVEQVTRRRVAAKVATLRDVRRTVRIAFVVQDDEDSIGTVDRTYVILEVGNFVDVNLAKRLRKGDALAISGELWEIMPIPLGLVRSGPVVSGLNFIVGKPKIEMHED